MILHTVCEARGGASGRPCMFPSGLYSHTLVFSKLCEEISQMNRNRDRREGRVGGRRENGKRGREAGGLKEGGREAGRQVPCGVDAMSPA